MGRRDLSETLSVVTGMSLEQWQEIVALALIRALHQAGLTWDDWPLFFAAFKSTLSYIEPFVDGERT